MPVDDDVLRGAHSSAAAMATASTRSQIRSALFRAHHMPQRRHPTEAQLEGGRKRLRGIVEPLLPLAKGHLDRAEGSRSDCARWKALIAGVQPLVTATGTSLNLTALSSNAVDLLQALLAAEVEGPDVKEIADHVRTMIREGVYLPGTKLGVGRIAADLGCSRSAEDRAELAFQDLQAEGLLTRRGSMWWVTEPTDQPTQIAGMIRTFIRTGVYPPGSPLPITGVLAREFTTSTAYLVKAWRILRNEGTVISRNGFRPVVSPVPPFPFDTPDDLGTLATRLRSLAVDDADHSPHVIEETCARARTWWRTRTSPPLATLEHTHAYLISAVLHLFRTNPDMPEAHTRLRRTAALAFDPHRITSSPLWRTACIAVVVGEFLGRAPA